MCVCWVCGVCVVYVVRSKQNPAFRASLLFVTHSSLYLNISLWSIVYIVILSLRITT